MKPSFLFAASCCAVSGLFLAYFDVRPSYGQDATAPALGKSLTFHASFDKGPDANFAKGDGTLWNAPAIEKRSEASKGLPSGGEVKLDSSGRFGGALRFGPSAGPIVFFKAPHNITMPKADWSGTISLWLSTDPANELRDGFCDPFQFTSKQWDDAAIFIEFEKRPAGIPFRLGVYADKTVWNPKGRKFEDIPPAERPLTTVNNPPFAGGKWTHIAVVFDKFNTGKPNGLATVFLDGKKAGEISAREQTFTWDPQHSALMLGLSYRGLMDDLAVFDRALSPEEVQSLFALKGGVADLAAKNSK